MSVKRIVNSFDKGEQITELEQFSVYPRALCDYSHNPVQGAESLITKFIRKQYPSCFYSLCNEGWKLQKVILEGMCMINSSPLLGQHKTFQDYATFW